MSLCLVCVTYKGEERVHRMLESGEYITDDIKHIVVYQDYAIDRNSYCRPRRSSTHYLGGTENLGVVAAYNKAIRMAVDERLIDAEDWIMLADDDVMWPNESFFVIVNDLISTIGPCVLSWKSSNNPPEIPGCVELATELAGYAFAFPYTFFQQLDGFDEKNFHHYCGDSDFARRVMRDLKRPCYRVHYPLVIHEEHAAVKENPELDGPSWAVKDRKNYRRKWAGVKERDLIRALLRGTDLED